MILNGIEDMVTRPDLAARSGAVAFSTYQPAIAIVLWPSNSPVALVSHILSEMFFQIRAESFGPLVERVFHCAGDDGCDAGITPDSQVIESPNNTHSFPVICSFGP